MKGIAVKLFITSSTAVGACACYTSTAVSTTKESLLFIISNRGRRRSGNGIGGAEGCRGISNTEGSREGGGKGRGNAEGSRGGGNKDRGDTEGGRGEGSSGFPPHF